MCSGAWPTSVHLWAWPTAYPSGARLYIYICKLYDFGIRDSNVFLQNREQSVNMALPDRITHNVRFSAHPHAEPTHGWIKGPLNMPDLYFDTDDVASNMCADTYQRLHSGDRVQFDVMLFGHLDQQRIYIYKAGSAEGHDRTKHGVGTEETCFGMQPAIRMLGKP